MCDYLIVGDVDHIQNYVFGSVRLRAIRGASALLDIAAERIKQSPPAPLKSDDVLRWRGGQIVAILRKGTEAQASGICACIEKSYRRLSAGEATITTACQPYQPDKFSENIESAFQKIRTEKDGKQDFGSYGESFLTSSYHRRCDFIPSFSGVCRITVESGSDREEKYMSRAAFARWQIVKSDVEIPSDRDLKCRFSADGIKSGRMPYRPEYLWPDKSDERYMALVMADGNGFGQLLQNIPNEKLYRAYSQDLHRLVLSSITLAAKESGIAAFYSKSLKEDILPLIPIILGGDDMSFLVRAEHAAGFAYHLCNAFQELSDRLASDGTSYIYPAVQEVISHSIEKNPEMGRLLFPDGQKKLTLSAGVAIAKMKFPISAFCRMANELEVLAKTELRGKPDCIREGGVIDFAVVTTSTVQSQDDIRRRYRFNDDPASISGGSETSLTQRPYTAEQFDKLMKLAAAFRNIPRGKRKFLYQEFFKGTVKAMEAYQFIMSREREYGKKISDILKEQFCYEKNNESPFHEETTPILDALELAELDTEGSS